MLDTRSPLGVLLGQSNDRNCYNPPPFLLFLIIAVYSIFARGLIFRNQPSYMYMEPTLTAGKRLVYIAKTTVLILYVLLYFIYVIVNYMFYVRTER